MKPPSLAGVLTGTCDPGSTNVPPPQILLEHCGIQTNGISELSTPTNAVAMPRDLIWHWNSFSADEPRESSAYVELKSETPCPPRGAVPVYQERGWEFFTRHVLLAFGNRCDRPAMLREQ